MFNDYKTYKKLEPEYCEWKKNRDLAEAKRLKYLELHPEKINNADIQRGKNLLRAIDIMDEYSQKKAEDMEATTEPIISTALVGIFSLGGVIGGATSFIKPVYNFFDKICTKLNITPGFKKFAVRGVPAAIGLILSSFAAFPLMAMGAKAEVGASRKGRFEAMRKDLNNPKGFAVLTDEQIKQAEEISKNIVLDEDLKKSLSKIVANGLSDLKNMVTDSEEYKQQRAQFEKELENDEKNLERELTSEEIEQAKKDQQLLTKLVEKIDIASQDYAENSEQAVQSVLLIAGAYESFCLVFLQKLLEKLHIKGAQKISKIGNIISTAVLIATAVLSASINKQASRIGRYKIKKELMNNPSNFVYVSDDEISSIKDVEVKPHKKEGLFTFVKNYFKDRKEYEEYQKTLGKNERKFFKAVEQLELAPEQMKNAKILQKNTFRTFNKVDENSQKYSESVEAIGQAITQPLQSLFTVISMAFAMPDIKKMRAKNQTGLEYATTFGRYTGKVFLGAIPSLFLLRYITKEQKKASRVADMQAINELNDYRKFS